MVELGVHHRTPGICSVLLTERIRDLRQSDFSDDRTFLAASSHRYCVEIPSSRLARVNACFFPSTSRLWNALPEHVFPESYDLSSFKRQVHQQYRDILFGCVG